MNLKEITDNLQKAVGDYNEMGLDELPRLSECLRTIDVNLCYLVHVRDEFYNKSQSVYFNSEAKTDAGKNREAQQKVPELDYCRKVLKHYGELQHSIRTQISLRKNHA